MPFYRFVRQFPPRLEYRDATVDLAVVCDATGAWALQARKVGFGQEPLTIVAVNDDRERFDACLNSGFFVRPHSPEAAIMERLHREDCAEIAHYPADSIMNNF